MREAAANLEADHRRNVVAYSRGDEYFRAGRFRDAIAFFREAFDADPQDSMCLLAIGNCWSELRKFKRAEASFRQALSLATELEVPALTFNLGNALYDQGRYSEAVTAYSQVPRGHAIWQASSRNIQLAQQHLAHGS